MHLSRGSRRLLEGCGIKTSCARADAMKHVIPGNQICHLLLARLVDGAAVGGDIEGQPRVNGNEGPYLPAAQQGRSDAGT